MTTVRRAPGDDRLRVMLLLPSLNGGGAERLAVHLMNRMDPGTFNVRMGLLRRAGPYLRQVDPDRVDASPFGGDRLDFDKGNRKIYRPGAMLAGSLLVPWSIRAMLKAFRPQVVMSFRKGMSIGVMFGTRFYGRRRVAWIAREGNNTLAVINEELDNRFARALVRRLTRHCYASADALLTISHDLRDMMVRNLRIPEPQVKTIYNAVDLERVRRLAAEDAPVPPGDPLIAAVGRLEPQKGMDVLVRAFAASRARASYRLLLVGQGPEEAALKTLAAELGVGDRLVMPGWVDNPFAWLARSAIFALPSRWEGFGNVVIEAMACGLPAIVSDCDFGPREIVQQGACGIVTPVGDVPSLAAAIDRVAGDPELRGRLVETGRARAVAFDVPTIVGQYQDLFAAVAGQHAQAFGQTAM